MFKVKTYNKISVKGLEKLPREQFEVASDINEPDAIILRSQKLKLNDIPESVRAIGRAGAGVNNIPVEECTKRGIVVFNAPGANANAVKELVIAGMLLSARDIHGGINYSTSIQSEGDNIPSLVEENKGNYKGYEIKGKKLGVIGLGAIGMMVANAGNALGMEVTGYDPFISVNRAWELSSDVKPAPSLERMLKTSDFISVHVPYTPETKGFLNDSKINFIKEGAVLLNFSRDALVDEEALKAALESGQVSRYVTDFPNQHWAGNDRVINIPHLGASTAEAEDNCAIMVATQVKNYLNKGNITNSVNFPNCELDRGDESRLIITNENVPNMLGQVTTIMADEGLNISEMVNKSKGDLAYNILDFKGEAKNGFLTSINQLDGVISARLV